MIGVSGLVIRAGPAWVSLLLTYGSPTVLRPIYSYTYKESIGLASITFSYV